ncbi:hypothetical protein HIC20_02850, partial [Buchnera aphidicola (Hormaphis cornu)]
MQNNKNHHGRFNLGMIQFKRALHKDIFFDFDINSKRIYKELMYVLKKKHIDFAHKLRKRIQKLFNCSLSIQLIKIRFQPLFKYFKKINSDVCVNNLIIEKSKNISYIIFSTKLISFSIEQIFGNGNHLNYSYLKKLKKTYVELYINNRLISIMKDTYNDIWEHKYVFDHLNYFNDFQKMRIEKFFSLHEIFIVVVFKIKMNVYQEELILCVPLNIFHCIQDDILKQCILKRSLNQFCQKDLKNKDKIQFSTIENLQLILIATLKEFKVSVITLLNL